MACINPDGTLTPSAQAVLKAAETPCSPAEIAKAANLPLFRVRSSLRELVEAGLLREENGSFTLTGEGRARLN